MGTQPKPKKKTEPRSQKFVSLFTGEPLDPDDPERMTFTERPGRGCIVHIRLTPREEKAIRRMATEDGYVDEIIWLKSIFLVAAGLPPVDPQRTSAQDLERDD